MSHVLSSPNLWEMHIQNKSKKLSFNGRLILKVDCSRFKNIINVCKFQHLEYEYNLIFPNISILQHIIYTMQTEMRIFLEMCL